MCQKAEVNKNEPERGFSSTKAPLPPHDVTVLDSVSLRSGIAMMFRRALAWDIWTARHGLTHCAPCVQRSLAGGAGVIGHRLSTFRVEDVTLP